MTSIALAWLQERGILDAAKAIELITLDNELCVILDGRTHVLQGHPDRSMEKGVLRVAVPLSGDADRNVFVTSMSPSATSALVSTVDLYPSYNKSSVQTPSRHPDLFTSACLIFRQCFIIPIVFHLLHELKAVGILPATARAGGDEEKSYLWTLSGLRMTEAQHREAITDFLGRYADCRLTILEWRHLDAALSRRLLHKKTVQVLLGDMSAVDEAIMADVMQAGHLVATNRRHYAREGSGFTAETTAAYRLASQRRNARLFQVDSGEGGVIIGAREGAMSGSGSGGAACSSAGASSVTRTEAQQQQQQHQKQQVQQQRQEQPPWQQEQDHQQAAPSLRLPARQLWPAMSGASRPTASMMARSLQLLASVLPPGSDRFFRDPALGEAMCRAVYTNRDIVLVAATGSGKAAIIQALALHNGQKGMWTVATMPLRALKDDQVRRAQQVTGLAVYAWEDLQAQADPCRMPPGLIVLTPEQAAAPPFLQFLPVIKGQLGHVIHDEAHYRVTWARFRRVSCSDDDDAAAVSIVIIYACFYDKGGLSL
jgi:hypothetical protein